MCCVYTCRSLAPYTRIFGPFAKIKWWEKFMHMHTRPPARNLFKVKHTHTHNTLVHALNIYVWALLNRNSASFHSFHSFSLRILSMLPLLLLAAASFSPFFNLLYFYVYILDRLFIEIHTHMRSCRIPFLFSNAWIEMCRTSNIHQVYYSSKGINLDGKNFNAYLFSWNGRRWICTFQCWSEFEWCLSVP